MASLKSQPIHNGERLGSPGRKLSLDSQDPSRIQVCCPYSCLPTQATFSKSLWTGTTTRRNHPTTLHPRLPIPTLAQSPLLPTRAFVQRWETVWLNPAFDVAQHSF